MHYLRCILNPVYTTSRLLPRRKLSLAIPQVDAHTASPRRQFLLSNRDLNCQSLGVHAKQAASPKDQLTRKRAGDSLLRARMATAGSAPSKIEDRQDSWPLAAVATMTSVGDQEANFKTCERLAKEAKSKNAAMLFLPECCTFIGKSQQETVSKAQPLDGQLMRKFQALAKELQLWVSVGGFQETAPEPGRMYNCHVIISSTGDIKAAYRKVHLFDVDVPDGPLLMESRSTSAGSKLETCDSPLGRLGVTICYDLRFPEVYQQLTFQQGAQILLAPSAFTKATGEAHWELLLRARAVECQCYVIAAAQAGSHNEKRESYGHSLIVDPWGRIIGKQTDPLSTGVAVASIDLDYLESVRMRMPVSEHRQRGRACLGWGKG